MMRWRLFGLIAVLAGSLAGCATKAQAVTVEPPMPALEPPSPPPRIVAAPAPEEEETVVAPPPVAEKPSPPPRPPARPARPEGKPEPARPEGGRTGTAPPLVLAPTPGSEGQTEAAIRNLLARAGRDLARVNVSALGADGRTQYETAQRFMQQAEDALKSKNLVFAGKLADKAATLASVFAR